tara:strand:+ start:442 stop:1920 length:1479 start_codon:yes stop_codon:yes gene_type:complete
MLDLKKLDLVTIRNSLRKGDFTSEELVGSYIDRINNSKKLNTYNTLNIENAINLAKESDKRILKKNYRPMEGIPIGIKDLFCTKGVKTTASSKMLENFTPTYESTITEKLFNQGMILIGKLSNDEFAMGSSNETSYLGPVLNPWKKETSDQYLVPGGSSGGSAAAVSASLCPVATATDTGGSIRQPASFTGTVGLKPTYGRCSRWGIVAFASSLDQAGPITKTVADSAAMLTHMAGYDEKDSTSSTAKNENYEEAIGVSLKGKTIGIPHEFERLDISLDIQNNWESAIQWYKDAGVNIKSIKLPHSKYALPAYYIIAPAEASSNLARYDGVKYGSRVEGEVLDDLYKKTRGAGFGEEVKRRIMMGTYVLSAGYYDAYYLKAQKVRRLIHQDFVDSFGSVDAILTPTTPTTAFEIGENVSDPLKMYSNDILTVPVNLAGLPAISIPSGLDKDGIPMGMQLITKHFDENSLFQFGSIIEMSRSDMFQPKDWWMN